MKKVVISLITGFVSFIGGFYFGGKSLVNVINNYKMRADRNLSNMVVLNDWLDYIYSGGKVEDFFQEHSYKKIMIYGNGYIGARLSQALRKTNIEVTAIMDRDGKTDTEGAVIGIDTEIPDVDCIIITPVYFYDEILTVLASKTQVPMISVKELFTRR